MIKFGSIFLISIFISFYSQITNAQLYTCDKQVFNQLDIKIQKSIVCAKQVGQRIHFTKLKKQLIKTFSKYQEKRKSLLDDRYQNTSSHQLQQTVLKDEKGNYIPIYFNKLGIAIRAKFYDNGADYFKDGLARYQFNDNIGFIDKSGKIIIMAKYPFVSPFQNGYAKACIKCFSKKDGEHTLIESEEWFYINKKGHRFNTILKEIKLPFEVVFQKDIFKEKAFDNTPKTRKKLSTLCQKGLNKKKACINYASFILEESLSFDLGHYQYSLRNISHSRMIKPSKGQLSESLLISTLENLTKVSQRIKVQLGIALYSLGQTQKALAILGAACKKQLLGEACHFYGMLLDHQLKFKPAIEAFNLACQLKVNQSCENKLMLK
jgi:hypothetical protein